MAIVSGARRLLSDQEFACQARVIAERRAEHGFVLTAWVFMPDHWHAIFYPGFPLTITLVMECIEVGSTRRINSGRGESGLLWQRRYFDRAFHQNPVRAGLVERAEDWPWSSVREYSGTV